MIELKIENLAKILEDIYLRHQINSEDTMVDKVIIIHSDQLEDGSKDGELDILFSKKGWYNHWIYWVKYLKTNYITDIRMRYYIENIQKTYFEIILACLNDYNDIIFLDFTDLDEQPKYSDAYLAIPASITEKQYQSLEKISEYIKKYKSITIQGGRKVGEAEEFFDCLSEFPIEEDIKGEEFEKLLKETIVKFKKKNGIQK